MIKDSGERRAFESGALRDVVEGKGRCDLLPLDVLANFYRLCTEKIWISELLSAIEAFIRTGATELLERAIVTFMVGEFDSSRRPFEDVSLETMWLEVAKHFEEGCAKYGENNWRKGIPAYCYIDSGVRHLFKWLRGDKDEPHHRAFVWNIICCIWTCRNLPHLNCYMNSEKAQNETRDEYKESEKCADTSDRRDHTFVYPIETKEYKR